MAGVAREVSSLIAQCAQLSVQVQSPPGSGTMGHPSSGVGAGGRRLGGVRVYKLSALTAEEGGVGMDLTSLPREVWLRVLGSLPMRDVASSSAVSRAWRAACEEGELWEEMYDASFGRDERGSDGQRWDYKAQAWSEVEWKLAFIDRFKRLRAMRKGRESKQQYTSGAYFKKTAAADPLEVSNFFQRSSSLY